MVVSVIVVALFTVFYHKIFAVTFDENFAKATGTRTDMYNLLIEMCIRDRSAILQVVSAAHELHLQKTVSVY